MSEWEEVGGTTENIWNYRELEKGAEFVGTFSKTRTGLGENNSSLHMFDKGDEKWGVWGCSVLDRKMDDVFDGTKVKLVYLGKEQGEQQRAYHNFQVFTKTTDTQDVENNDMPF